MSGALVAFEGIDQAGKLTQARAVRDALELRGAHCVMMHYPDYSTPIGRILEQALCEGLRLDARARTMLFAANRWEQDVEVRTHVAEGAIVLVDRYTASNLVYGLSQGYDRDWLSALEKGLLVADVTVFVDISPQESVRRKESGRDDFERNRQLLVKARENYKQLALQEGWLVVDGEAAPEEVTRKIIAGVCERLAAQNPALAHMRIATPESNPG